MRIPPSHSKEGESVFFVSANSYSDVSRLRPIASSPPKASLRAKAEYERAVAKNRIFYEKNCTNEEIFIYLHC